MPSCRTSMLEFVIAVAMSSTIPPIWDASRPMPTMMLVTMSAVVPISNMPMDASLRDGSKAVRASSVFRPAIPRYMRPSETSRAVNTVFSARERTSSVKRTVFAPEASMMALTRSIWDSNSVPAWIELFNAEPTPYTAEANRMVELVNIPNEVPMPARPARKPAVAWLDRLIAAVSSRTLRLNLSVAVPAFRSSSRVCLS